MGRLPSGVVTFLFTDIEGSSRLWEQHPREMQASLVRHDELMAAGIEQHGGSVVKEKGEGDSIFAVFPDAAGAVAAACAIQQALFAEPWPTGTPVRVRMALHTGEAQLREGDYFGDAVNRCARLRSMTYGGQVVLSEETAALVRDRLPPEAGLEDLGFLQLRNLLRAEHAFQLLHPSLPAEFPLKETIPPCPYRGLFAFREEDADFFFGRDRFIGHLLGAVQTRVLTAVMGPSGSGKSSLVYAGLLPALMKKEPCVVLHFRPGAQPFYSLAAATVPVLDGHQAEADLASETRLLADSIERGHAELAELVENVARRTDPPARVVVIVDQFEELYTLCRQQETRLRFLDVLVGLLDRLSSFPDVRCNLLLTLRADFCGHAISYRPLSDALQEADLKLGPMTRAELKQAIEKPAHKMGVGVEEGLIDRILDAVSEAPGDLPLLEFALTRMWEKQRGGRLVHTAYDDAGGVEGALAKYAEETFTALNEDDQERARKIFVQLVQPGEATEDTRRIATRSEIGEENWELARRLADARLVVTGRTDLESGQAETVEIVHEALIREWGRFQEWMEVDRAFRVWQERLRAAMRQWHANDRESGALLRGAPLAEAQRWLADRGEELAQPEREYIADSIASSEQEAAARERTRRRTITGLGTGLAVAIVLMALAGWQWFEAEVARQQAQEQAEIATGRRLAAEAISLLPSQYDLALLLSVESSHVGLGTSFEAQNSLLSALQHDPGVLRFLHGHTGWVMKVAFSPDGALMASGGEDGSVFLWDVAERTPVGDPLLGHTDAVNSVAFSPDGRLLASGSGDGTIVLWDVQTRSPVGEPLVGHAADVWRVSFSADGELLVSGSGDGALIVWDVRNGQAVAHLPDAHPGGAWAVEFSPAGGLLATAGADGSIVFRDAQTFEPAGAAISAGDEPSPVTSMVFSPDGRVVAASNALGMITLWDVETRGPVGDALMGHTGGVAAVAFSPDGAFLVSAGEDHSLVLWDIETGRPVGLPLTAHTGPVTSVAFSPDGQMIVSGGQDSKVVLRTVGSRPPIGVPVPSPTGRAMTGTAFSPVGDILAVGSANGDIVLWDPSSHQPSGAPLAGHADLVWTLTFSPDGRLLASGSRDNTVRLWDMDRRQPFGEPLTAHTDTVWALAFSPDGRMLASGSGDGTIVLWDVASGQPLGDPIQAPDGPLGDDVFALAFSPDGTLLASAGEDGHVTLWDVEERRPAGDPIGPHPLAVWSVSFSPDGSMLAAATGEGRVILWDVESGERAGEALWGRHTGYVFDATFSPDGRMLASAGSDGTVILWDLERRQPLGRPLAGHTDMVFSTAFSPDGWLLASASADASIIVWDMHPESWGRQACDIANRNMTEAEWRVYMGGSEYRETCTGT